MTEKTKLPAAELNQVEVGDDPKPTTMVTHVDLNNSDALYIYVENKSKFPPQKFHQYIQRIEEQFKIAFPDRTIIVGMDDLKFTVISKKQEFKAKLDGTL